MPKYEDPSLDPEIEEAILNIKQVLRWLYVMWEANQRDDNISGAISDLEQAVRYLRGEESAA